jgi:LacI family transcriptional regulator
MPEKLQLICFSNGPLSNYTYPKMIVIDKHASETGKKSFIRMLNLLNNTDTIKINKAHTLKVSLIKKGNY